VSSSTTVGASAGCTCHWAAIGSGLAWPTGSSTRRSMKGQTEATRSGRGNGDGSAGNPAPYRQLPSWLLCPKSPSPVMHHDEGWRSPQPASSVARWFPRKSGMRPSRRQITAPALRDVNDGGSDGRANFSHASSKIRPPSLLAVGDGDGRLHRRCRSRRASRRCRTRGGPNRTSAASSHRRRSLERGTHFRPPTRPHARRERSPRW
jgi:hypothetical protein